ncbi:hypothetical protein Btru_046814 [Bulinus truncatus]|nr:hypothetical protein Btru_046814 [Bulinus truncatus]
MFSRIAAIALCACLTLNLAASQLTTDVCPPHLTRDQYLQVRGGICYQFVVYRALTHTDAKAECEKNGEGSLVLIKDQDTQSYLQNELHNTFHATSAHFWTGLNDILHENDFVWDDGTRPVYTDWANGGNPGASGNHESNDCVVIDMAAGGKWQVFHCDVRYNFLFLHPAETHNFICEYPIRAAATTSQPPNTPAPVSVVTSVTHPCPSLMIHFSNFLGSHRLIRTFFPNVSNVKLCDYFIIFYSMFLFKSYIF